MGNLRIVSGNELDIFDPATAKETQAKGEAIIGYAKDVKDWPTLIEAIDKLVGHQREIVAWWTENVRGKGRPKNAQDRAHLLSSNAEKIIGFPNETVSRWKRCLSDDIAYKERLFGDCYEAAMSEKSGGPVRGTGGTGDNEWYTPKLYIELAREVLGNIDLDPASNANAQAVVRADKIYTIETDGLKQQWNGNVWLNPPYAQPAIGHFVNKLIEEVSAGHTAAAILLTHNYTDTSWFQSAAESCSAICFTRGRIGFVCGDRVAAPTQGQAFTYFGNKESLFGKVFNSVGLVVQPWRPRRGKA